MAFASEAGRVAKWASRISAVLATATSSFVFCFAIELTEYQQANRKTSDAAVKFLV
jgi:hypothetical protein